MKINRPTRITEEAETLDDAYNTMIIDQLPARYQALRAESVWNQLQAVPSYVERPNKEDLPVLYPAPRPGEDR